MHITNKHASRIIPLGTVVNRKSYLPVRTSISWTSLSCLSLSIQCQNDNCIVQCALTSDTAVNPESINYSLMIPHLWLSAQREKLTAVTASLNVAQDVYTLSCSMAMYEAVTNEKCVKPASIKLYIVANSKCNLIQSVLTWLWGSMCFLALFGLVSQVPLHCFLCQSKAQRMALCCKETLSWCQLPSPLLYRFRGEISLLGHIPGCFLLSLFCQA